MSNSGFIEVFFEGSPRCTITLLVPVDFINILGFEPQEVPQTVKGLVDAVLDSALGTNIYAVTIDGTIIHPEAYDTTIATGVTICVYVDGWPITNSKGADLEIVELPYTAYIVVLCQLGSENVALDSGFIPADLVALRGDLLKAGAVLVGADCFVQREDGVRIPESVRMIKSAELGSDLRTLFAGVEPDISDSCHIDIIYSLPPPYA